MKYIYLKILFLAFCLFTHGRICSITIDEICYDLNNDSKEAIVIKPERGIVYSGDMIIPEFVHYDGTAYSVTMIGENAFRYCKDLKSIELPNSLTAICDQSFYGCESLEAFNFPDNLESVGEYAFHQTSWYDNLEDGPVYVGRVFYGYKGTIPDGTDFVIREGTISIGKKVFGNEAYKIRSLSIPGTVKVIGDQAFRGCNNLLTLEILNGVTCIGDFAFSGCYSLMQLYLPSSVQKIGREAFYSAGLYTINVQDSVVSIGSGAFHHTPWYENLADGPIYLGRVFYEYKGTLPDSSQIMIKDGTTEICDYAFYNYGFNGSNRRCPVPSVSVVIPESVKSIGEEAFWGCENISSITIPDSIVDIGYGAFYGCGFHSLTIPEKVTSIEGSTFSGCVNLSSIVIPQGVTVIGSDAFFNCESLRTIEIPQSVTSIGSGAFRWDKKLSSVKVNWNRPLVGGADSFDQIVKETATLYVPKGTAMMYMSASGWADFLNIVEFEDEDDAHYISIRMGEGGVLKQSVEIGGIYTYSVSANDGWSVNTVTFDGKDMTSLLLNGQFSTPVITGNSELSIVFKQIGANVTERTSIISNVKVFAYDNCIEVSGADQNIRVVVFTTDGALVKVGNGNANFVLESGIYIVKVGNETFKVAL